jgi:hypothetical protein
MDVSGFYSVIDGPVKSRETDDKVMPPTHSEGHPGNFIIFGLCRFIPAYKAGLSPHLPAKGFTCKARKS